MPPVSVVWELSYFNALILRRLVKPMDETRKPARVTSMRNVCSPCSPRTLSGVVFEKVELFFGLFSPESYTKGDRFRAGSRLDGVRRGAVQVAN